MANMTESRMSVVLPTRKAKQFLGYFGWPEESEKGRYFEGTVVVDIDQNDNNKGMTCLIIDFNCRWSVANCMLDVESEENAADGPISLQHAIDACEVRRLRCHSDEPGMGFGEEITYNREETRSLEYQSHDIVEPWDCADDDEDEDPGASIGDMQKENK